MTKLEKLKKQLSELQEEIVQLEENEKHKELAARSPLEIEMCKVTTKFVMRKIPRHCPSCWVDLGDPNGKGLEVAGYSPSRENWTLVDANETCWRSAESLDEGELSYVTTVRCAACEKLLAEIEEQ
jgi:hypothetical protein